MRRSWTNTGFWLILGLAGGLLISDLTREPTAAAGSGATVNQEYCMATGANFAGKNDIVWLLDYAAGRLHCITTGAKGELGTLGVLDIAEQFQIQGEGKPHFMMVTGGFTSQRVDLLYLAETTTGVVACYAPPGRLGAPPELLGTIPFKAATEVIR